MPNFYLSYIDLSPELRNHFSDSTHTILIEALNKEFLTWTEYFDKYPEYDLGFIITTKIGVDELFVKGPSISKKMKVVDYTIFLPNIINDIEQYVNLVFEGINIVLKKYNIDGNNIIAIREICKEELNLSAY